MPDEIMIRVAGEGTSTNQRLLYSKTKYVEILQKIDEMFGDVETAKVGDKDSELETFLEVYKRMSAVAYDYYAVSAEGKNNGRLGATCRNLEGGILEGKCVCAGYAEILRNVLAQKGVEAKYISGMQEGAGPGHAWNQVKIGGAWFNVDITWDRNELRERLQRGEVIGIEYLRTDEQFRDHTVFSISRTEGEEKCTIPIESVLAPEPQTLGTQVAELLQENGITKTEFANQYRQIQDMQNDLNRQEKQEQQGFEI